MICLREAQASLGEAHIIAKHIICHRQHRSFVSCGHKRKNPSRLRWIFWRRVDKKDHGLKMVLLAFFLFINDETNNINNKYHNIDNQKDGKYCLRLLQHRYSRPINSTYSGYNANNPKEIFILSHSILLYPKKRIKIIAITVNIETSVANIATKT